MLFICIHVLVLKHRVIIPFFQKETFLLLDYLDYLTMLMA